MIYIFIVCLAFLAGQYLPDFLQPLIFKIKKLTNKRRLKPFDCSACLSFWTSLILLSYYTNIVIALLISGALFIFVVWFELIKIENEL